MRKLLLLITVIFSTAVCSDIYAQQVTPPPGVGDKDLRDTDVKRRSVEMERVERDAKKKGKSADKTTAPAVDPLAAKYGEIKTDYEQIQLSQDAVINIFQSGSKIDYAQIGKSALEINRSATRLHSNLFPAALPVENENIKKEEKKDDKTRVETKPAKSVRDLIVELDNTIGVFVTSPMFQNLRTLEAQAAAKAKLDLEKIIELSALLDAEVRKLETNGN